MAISIFSDSNQWQIIRSLYQSQQDMLLSLARLSSGLAINSAADGPADMVISEQLRSQIATLNQEIDNISTNINKYEYASSVTAQLREKLTDLKSLAVGAANTGGNSDAAQAAYEASQVSIVASYNYVIDTAEYNGSKLFDGSEGSLAVIDKLEGIDFTSAESAEASMSVIDDAIEQLDSVQVELGATQKNELESQRASLEVSRENLIAAESSLRDVDYAMEFANFISSTIRLQAGVSLMTHSWVQADSVIKLFNS